MSDHIIEHLTTKHGPGSREPIRPRYLVVHDTEGSMPGDLYWLADAPAAGSMLGGQMFDNMVAHLPLFSGIAPWLMSAAARYSARQGGGSELLRFVGPYP